MKYLCLIYYDEKNLDALPPGTTEAIMNECFPSATSCVKMAITLQPKHCSLFRRPRRYGSGTAKCLPPMDRLQRRRSS